MAFLLSSDISIGLFNRMKVNEAKITKSIFEYVDKALIKIPGKARLKLKDDNLSTIEGEVFDSAKAFTEGEKVLIKLGYNNVLQNEFEGFISRVNFTTPVQIECEGYSYLLRKKSYLKAFKQTTLTAILQYLVDGTIITLSKNIPDLKIEKWVINQQNGTEVLEQLKKELLLSIFFTGSELYAGLRYLNAKADVKYRLGWNVIKDDNLKLRQAKNQEVIIKFIGEKPDGTKVTAGVGSKGEVKVIKSHSITDQATAKAIAEKHSEDLSYDGYEGKITAFLTPYCEPGYRAKLEDIRYPERSGNYIVESTEVTYSISGARRIVGIGIKL